MVEGFVSERGERAVCVYEVDPLAEEDIAEVGEEEEEVWECCAGCDGQDGEVVDLEAGEVADADSPGVMVGNHDHLDNC